MEWIQKRAGLLGICSGLISTAGIAMLFWRNSQQQLWSYWSLVVLFFGWWAFLLLVKRKALRQKEQWKYLGQASLSGLLLGLAFPFSNLPTGMLAAVGWIPLFLMIEDQIKRGWRMRQIYFYCFHALLLWNIVATYWVANSSLPAGLFAILVNAALMGLPFLLQIKARQFMPRLKWVPFLAFWLSFEYMHYHWELNWPWLSLGNVWANAPALVQWYSLTGVLGGSLWILLLNILGLETYRAFRTQTAQRSKQYFRFSAVLVLPILISLIQYARYTPQGTEVAVTVIQPNVEPFYERPLLEANKLRERLIELGNTYADANTQYIVYPEATLDFVDQNGLEEAPAIIEMRQRLLRDKPRASVIIGSDAFRFLEQDEAPGRYSRRQERDGQVNYFEIYNAAIQFGAEQESVAFYKKSKLVPGAELFPYPKVFRFLKPLVEQLGGTMAGRGAQRERSNFRKDSLLVAPAICYESVFGGHLAQHVQNGAQAIFIITNDAWWDQTAGHVQHFHYARLRAVENRRPVARAANTGISGFIDQRGRILSRTQYRETSGQAASLLFNSKRTYYSKNPDLIARFALFAAAAFFLNWIVRSLLPKD